jgi:hypothetical protein
VHGARSTSAKWFCVGRTEKMNVEHRTFNIEHRMTKDKETEKSIKNFVKSIKTAEKKSSLGVFGRAVLDVCFLIRYWTFDVRCSVCSMSGVHLFDKLSKPPELSIR